MKEATAMRSFRRSDLGVPVRVGERILGREGYIDELAKIGLVREVAAAPAAPERKEAPISADGEARRSSASPAAQASLQTTANESGSGGARRRTAASS
jgi:hypothetical protein